MQKFPLRFACSPAHNRFRIAVLGIVEAADQCGQNVAVTEVIVVAESVEICRHQADRVKVVLQA